MFNNKISFKYVMFFLSIISRRILIEYILNSFLTPLKSKVHKSILKTECKYDYVHIGNNQWVKTYIWGNGDQVVLLAHAWGSNGSHMVNFVQPLLNNNFKIVAFDAPAHGQSSGKTCDMFQYANTIRILYYKYNINSIISHSFGSGCSLLATKMYNLKFKSIITIGCFADAQLITDLYAKEHNISQIDIRTMERLLEFKYANLWTWENISPKNTIKGLQNVKLLLIHDEDDIEVPYTQFQSLITKNKNIKYFSTKKLGHRKIIFHKKTISSISILF